MNRFIEECCKGPRLAGTPDNERLIEQIERAFQELDYPVARQEFTFVGWEVPDPPKVSLAGRAQKEFTSRAITWCGGTRGIDLRGKVVKKGEMKFWGRGCDDRVYERWSLVSAAGVEHGNVYFIGKYPTHLVLPYPEKEVVYVSMPNQELKYLAQHSEEVHVTMRTSMQFGAKSVNVIATKWGASSNEIVVCAHHDTVYDALNGLHDNGGGCIALLKLAEIFKNVETNHTLRFVATGSEEFNLTGAREYVRMRKQDGTLSHIKGCIDIDFITQFPARIGVTCTNEFDNVTRDVIDDQKLLGHVFECPAYFERKTCCSDAWAFEEKGIPAFLACFGPKYSPHIPGVLEEDLDRILANIDVNVQFLKAIILRADQSFASVRTKLG